MVRASVRVSLVVVMIALTTLLLSNGRLMVVRSAEPLWAAYYWNNTQLSGDPAVQRAEPGIAYDWGDGSPDPRIFADGFSARWIGTIDVPAGDYVFTATSDDGMRVYVDGSLVLHRWYDHAQMTASAVVSLTPGYHSITVEYYENKGLALATFSWRPVSLPAGSWHGEYFDNIRLLGPPQVVRDDPIIGFNWGDGSPDPRLPTDGFSARWTRFLYVPAGLYRFTASSDDGMRVWVDGERAIDQWYDHPAITVSVEQPLAAGNHEVIVEYYEMGGGALAVFSWAPVPMPIQDWRGEYYNNTSLAGNPVLVRDDREIRFDWGDVSPGWSVNADQFSVRWTRQLEFPTGWYVFTTETDDGLRLYVDDRLVIDRWQRMARSAFSARVYLEGGMHTVRMEYFEDSGVAYARLVWRGPIRVPTSANLITCVPPYPSYSWIKAYRLTEVGTWEDVNAKGWGSISSTGYIKIDGLPVDVATFGESGNPYWVEQWVDGKLARSVGNTDRGEPEFVLQPGVDNATPWQCPAP